MLTGIVAVNGDTSGVVPARGGFTWWVHVGGVCRGGWLRDRAAAEDVRDQMTLMLARETGRTS